MMIQKTFSTREEMIIEKKNLHRTYTPLHTDFVNNEFVVTFVNGDDDPANSEESKDAEIKFQRHKELSAKLQDDSITFDELKEYLRSK